MTPELNAQVVEGRLRVVAELYVPETVEEGRARLVAEASAPDAFATAVERRLEELRALHDLWQFLQDRRS